MKQRTGNNQPEDEKAARGRGEVWKRVRGMWKDRKPDPIEELSKMREEWEERLKEQEKIWRSKH